MQVLKKGDNGAAVVTLQKGLTAAGFSTIADGSFGPVTEANVKAFQTAKTLTIDGVVGAQTWAALGIQAPHYIMGVDVSHYETGFDFVKGVKDGVEFMMTKASEGVSVDSTCASECAKAAKAGVKRRGIYHFHHTSISTASQLAIFLKQYKASDQNMPPILDLEETSVDGHTYSQVKESALALLVAMEAATGKIPLLYIDMNMVSLLGIQSDTRFTKYPRWIAKYSATEPTINWTFWQFTDKGEQGADTDWFHGTEADLDKFIGAV